MYRLTWAQYKKTRRPCCATACEECPYKESIFGNTSLKNEVKEALDNIAAENSVVHDFEDKYHDADKIISRLKEKAPIKKNEEKQLKKDFEKYFHARIDKDNVTHF